MRGRWLVVPVLGLLTVGTAGCGGSGSDVRASVSSSSPTLPAVPTTVAAPVTTTAAPTTTVAAGDGPAAVGPEECRVVSAPLLEKVFGGPPPVPEIAEGDTSLSRVCDWKSQEKHIALRVDRTYATAFAGFQHDKGVVELTGLDQPALVQVGTDRPEVTVMVKVSAAAAIEVRLFASPPDQDLVRQVAADVLPRWETLPRRSA